ncbi:MAG TPA: histidine phosphatase family protein [Steroidobacteraceae bacterium]|jgi:phosphohistidine phosphatase|nr:histidine phosphatase family protein [Steroidobacteraceae bacterium]
MKRLTLMRHGDARWKDAGLSDLERPLNRRGVGAAEAMAQRLHALELVPDLLLVSPARRTQQTAEIVARELAIPARRVVRNEALYLASAADLLKVVQATGPRVAHLLLVAHNPGLSELLQLLAPDGERGGLGTAAVCSMSFEVPAWNAIAAGAVREVRCENPPKGLFGLFG